MISLSAAVVLGGMLFQSAAPSTSPIIDNARTTVWDTTAPKPAAHDYVAISLNDGTAKLGKAGSTPQAKGRTIVIEIKDHAPDPLPNRSGLPNAFPRPGSKKLFETPKVIVWDYTWKPGEATPMHFHDKDVVVTYLKDGSLQSTSPSGEKTVNDYKFGAVKFNLRDRTHTETLVKGSQRAIITEFK